MRCSVCNRQLNGEGVGDWNTAPFPGIACPNCKAKADEKREHQQRVETASAYFHIRPDDTAGVQALRILEKLCDTHLCAQECSHCDMRPGGPAMAAIAALLRKDTP